MHPVIGINLPNKTSFGNLDETLRQIKGNGFDAVEINIETYPLIIGAEICHEWLALLKQTLRKHDLTYTAHIGRGLDLRSLGDHAYHTKVLNASLQICSELNMKVLVLHYEVKSQNQVAEKQFVEAHRKAAFLAAELGVVICVENIEVELVLPVVELAQEIDHPNLRLNLDTGHAFLAAHYYQFDFLKAVEMMAPYLGHVHLNDNTGTFESLRITNRTVYDGLPMGYRREFGRGDIHLPPFYGKLPFGEVLSRIPPDYSGIFICEYMSEDFGPLNKKIQEQVRLAVEGSRP
ncbi:MAG: sugar phosphate isomerase/epimerase [Sphaerochaeta sp.]|nr:sugar phosphate isomerase/epimerase [Sphaerochaeta sp.]